MTYKILIYTEFSNNKPVNSSLELITYVNKIIENEKRNIVEVLSVVFSDEQLSDENKNLLYSTGANSILNVVGSGYDVYNLSAQKFAINNIISFEKPDVILFSTTDIQREIAPTIATSIGAGLCADCTSLKFDFNDNSFRLIATRPTFGGKLMAEISYKCSPNMATVREGVSKISTDFDFDLKKYKKISLDYKSNLFMNILDCNQMLKAESTLNKNAQVMLAAGMGIKNNIVISKLNALSDKLNAIGIKTSICASRKAVEAGLFNKSAQVGQTGSFVCPDIYIALGISGAIHHMVGCENSKKIIAVNTDRFAPIVSQCDYFVESDTEEFIDKFLTNLKR